MLKLIYSMADLDVEQLLELYKGQGVDENDFLDYLRVDFFKQKNSFYGIWVVEGYYLSALRMQPYNDGLLLTGLATSADVRRKGYGYLLVSEVLKQLSSCEYKIVYSHIHKKNVPSIKLHDKCGFKMCSDSARYIDGTVTQNSCTMCYYL